MSGIEHSNSKEKVSRLSPRVAGLFRFWNTQKREGSVVPKKKSKRKKLYDLHAWLGFHLAVIMSLVLFTGTMATISQELDWLANPAMRVTPDSEAVLMQTMIEAVEAYEPTSTVWSIGESEGDYFAYKASVIDENGITKTVHVNQWTGEVTGESGFFNIKYFFRQLHRYLFLPKTIGLTIVSSMAIILSISLYTGLKTSRNWRTLMTRIRFSKGARTAIGDAHKATGLWSIWFFVLIISTGLWYYAEFLGSDFEPRYPDLSEERMVRLGDTIVDRPLPEIIDVAQSTFPELEIKTVTRGAILGRTAIWVEGKAGNPIVRDRANRVYLDPGTLEVTHVARDRDLGWVQWLNQIADPLHFGNFGGLAVKLIWFTFGLFMTGLSLSGVWLTWRRLRLSGASRMQLLSLPIVVLAGVAGSLSYIATTLPFLFGVPLYAAGWFIVGLWLWGLSLLGSWLFLKRLKRSGLKRQSLLNGLYATLILAAGSGAVHATVLQRPFDDRVERELGWQENGPVRANLFLETNGTKEPSGRSRMVISGVGGRPNLKSMSIQLVDSAGKPLNDEPDIERKFRMRLKVQPAFFELDKTDVRAAKRISITFEMQSGKKESLSWSLRN